MDARCQCGQINFTTPTPKPLELTVCHCTECRHQSSSSYGLTAVFPYFELPPSAPVGSYTRQTLKGRQKECLFCTNCGARILHRVREDVPLPGEKPAEDAVVLLKAGCLVGLTKEMMDGAAHIWCKEAIVDIPEHAERWEEEPEDGK